jgi:hypothetical protein
VDERADPLSIGRCVSILRGIELADIQCARATKGRARQDTRTPIMDKKNVSKDAPLALNKTTIKKLGARLRTGVKAGRAPTMTGTTVCREAHCHSSRMCT